MTRYVIPSIRKKVIERDMKCVYCGLPVATVVGEDALYAKRWKAYDSTSKSFHFDHSKPHALGGSNDETNIRLACEKCNLAKARKEAAQVAATKGEAMLHTIKVGEGVYQSLLLMQRPRETFSEIVSRLISLSDLLMKAAPIIEGQHAYYESRKTAEEAKHPVD